MNLPVLMSRDLEAGESTGYPCERMEAGIVPGALESGMEPEANGCRHHKLKHCERESRREETFFSWQLPETRIGVSRSLPVHTAGMPPEGRHRPETAPVPGR